MQYTLTDKDEGITVSLSGQFTFDDNQHFKAIMDSLKNARMRYLDMNFSKVDFIDSAGLGMLLLLRDFCQNNGVPVSLSGAKGQVSKIFTLSRFDQLFSMRA